MIKKNNEFGNTEYENMISSIVDKMIYLDEVQSMIKDKLIEAEYLCQKNLKECEALSRIIEKHKASNDIFNQYT